mgnify:CR=1 FL=1
MGDTNRRTNADDDEDEERTYAESRETPVEEGCVFCKVPEEDAAEGVEFHDLPTGEEICSECVADLRPYKRDRAILLFLHNEIPDDVGEDLSEAVWSSVEETLDDHGYEWGGNTSSTSNAAEGFREE